MTLETACPKQKAPLDEGSFQQLLAAAYVIQQHGLSLHTGDVQPETAQMLPAIIDIQSRVRTGSLTVSEASKRITDCLLEALHAGGVSISLVTDGYLDCVAESGSPANVPGSSLASHSLVATERLKSGAIFNSSDAQTDIRLDCNMCSRLRVQSLVAAPIFRLGEIAGLIEVRWPKANAFDEAELFTIQLMAGLLTEMLEQRAAVKPQQESGGQYSDRAATRLQAIAETQREQVPARHEGAPVGQLVGSRDQAEEARTAEFTSAGTPSLAKPSDASCRVCGRAFRDDEPFCGYCSMPRLVANSSEGMQSKWASLWFIQKAKSSLEGTEGSIPDTHEASEQIASLAPETIPPHADIQAPMPSSTAMPQNANFSYFRPTSEEYRASTDVVPLGKEPGLGETSPRATQFPQKRLRLRDIVLSLVAAALTFALVSAWPSSTGRMTWFGSAMVRLGLAHAPASATYGNPGASVWVDVRSKLYYCDGSELYGSTPEGYFSTQRSAQLEKFEPATGLACQ